MGRNTRVRGNNDWPRNTDRSGWADIAVAKFAKATGMREDLASDLGTVLVDLLADLMHWCDSRKSHSHLVEETVDFEAALARARDHYKEEFANEETGRLEDPHAP